jgi:beta-glucosidase
VLCACKIHHWAFASVSQCALSRSWRSDSKVADYNSAFPAGGTVAASWDRQVWYERGNAMGAEFNGKGIDVQLGPVVGPLGRAPAGGRNWEGFSPDPFLSGKAVAQTVKGIQDAGVIACKCIPCLSR